MPVIFMLVSQLVRTASFSRGGQMSFTNLDVPSPDRFQLSFGFQTFQPSGTLLNHQTRVRRKPGSKLSAKSSREILKEEELGILSAITVILPGTSNSPSTWGDPARKLARWYITIHRAQSVCTEQSFPFFTKMC